MLLGLLVLPFAVLWCFILLLSSWYIALTARPAADDAGERRRDAASIMILNWNGREMLGRMLPTVRRAVAEHGGDHEILVIDNGSGDGSVEFVEREFPEVVLIRYAENRKFVRGYNDAFARANRDIVVLLNNDMLVDPDFLTPLLAGFEDPQTFAVSAQIFLADPDARRVETGLTGGRISGGLLKLRHDAVTEHHRGLIPVLWAGGGSAAFDRRRLLELGGFDALYDPFYFEDTGLSYEAWKRGWQVLFAPAAKVVHEHQASSSRLPRNEVLRIKRRNQHLFGWRHLTESRHAISSSLLLPINLLRLALAGDGGTLWSRALIEAGGLTMTLPRLPALLRARVHHGRQARRSDQEVLRLAHSRHRLERSRGRRAEPRLRILMLTGRVPKCGVDGSWGLFELIRRLGKHHQVTLFSFADRDEDPRHLDALRPLVHRLQTEPLQRDLGELDLHHRTPVRIRRYYSGPQLQQTVANLLRSESFDLVQVDYFEMAAMVRDQLTGVRSVHVVHEPLFRYLELRQIHGLLPRLRRWLHYAQAVNFEARLYPRFTRVSCLTPVDESQIKRWLPRLATVVNPIGVDVEQIQAGAPSTGLTLVSIGYFGHPPNVDAALWFVEQILPRVHAELPEVRLRLIGGGAPPQITALGQRPGVELLGYVDDLAGEMAACVLALAPNREGGGLRTKVLESMAYGRTMVATPVATQGILVEDGVHLRITADPQAFAQAVIELLRDPQQRHRLERAGRQLVLEHYTGAAMAARSEALFRELCQ